MAEGDTAGIVYGVGLIIIISIIFILVGRRMRAQTNAAWSAAAEALGLNFTTRKSGHYEMSGTISGFQCSVYTHTVSHGKSSSTHTKIKVKYPQTLNLGLKIKPQGVFGGLAKMFGAQDIQVGYESAFDKAFTIKGRDEDEVREYLTAERKQVLLSTLRSMKTFTVKDDKVKCSHNGVNRDGPTLIRKVTSLVELASVMAGEAKPGSDYRQGWLGSISDTSNPEQ